MHSDKIWLTHTKTVIISEIHQWKQLPQSFISFQVIGMFKHRLNASVFMLCHCLQQRTFTYSWTHKQISYCRNLLCVWPGKLLEGYLPTSMDALENYLNYTSNPRKSPTTEQNVPGSICITIRLYHTALSGHLLCIC